MGKGGTSSERDGIPALGSGKDRETPAIPERDNWENPMLGTLKLGKGGAVMLGNGTPVNMFVGSDNVGRLPNRLVAPSKSDRTESRGMLLGRLLKRLVAPRS